MNVNKSASGVQLSVTSGFKLQSEVPQVHKTPGKRVNTKTCPSGPRTVPNQGFESYEVKSYAKDARRETKPRRRKVVQCDQRNTK